MEKQSKEYVLCDDCKACIEYEEWPEIIHQQCRLYSKGPDGFPYVNNSNSKTKDGCFEGMQREANETV